MNKKILIGSICTMFILVLVSFTSIVSAQSTVRNDIKERYDKLTNNLSDFKIIKVLLNLLLGFFTGVGFVKSAVILSIWILLYSAFH